MIQKGKAHTTASGEIVKILWGKNYCYKQKNTIQRYTEKIITNTQAQHTHTYTNTHTKKTEIY